MTLTGCVMAVQANFYRVKLDQPQGDTDRLLCVRRARLKKIGQQVCVGDRVVVAEPDWQGQRGAITEVLPRRNCLERPAIANIDRLILMFAFPDPDPMQISRFLVYGEFLQAQIVLCLNKRDLIDLVTWQAWHDRLQEWGYDPIPLSVERGEGIDRVQGLLKDGVSVLAGPSGVGKSSLINRLLPHQQVATGTVDPRYGRGRHTTRHVELFELDQGGKLADSPGFLQPSLPLHPRQLGLCFPEIKRQLAHDRCEFSDCLHQGEQGCRVSSQWERYSHYCQFLAEVQAQQIVLETTANPDREGKTKTKKGGDEPLLSRKKYRRPSRRRLVQSVDQDLEGTGQT